MNFSRFVVATGLSVVLSGGVSPGIHNALAQQTEYYIYQDKQIQLRRSTEIVAVRFKEGVDDEVLSRDLQRLGARSVGDPTSAFSFRQIKADEVEGILPDLRNLKSLEAVSPVYIDEHGKQLIPGNEIIVRFRKGTNKEDINKLFEQEKVSILRYDVRRPDRYVVSVPWNQSVRVIETSNELSRSPLTLHANPSFERRGWKLGVPNDVYYPDQYHLPQIKAPGGWDIETGDFLKTIAIVDDGVDLAHWDYFTKIVSPYDAVPDPPDFDPTPNCLDGHGTACAGLAAATGNNVEGVAGVAYGCAIMPIRVFSGPNATDDDLIEGVFQAWFSGADVISCSWGGGSPNADLTYEIDLATSMGRGGKGCIVVFAAGNNGGAVEYPANLPNTIAVGAVDRNDVWSYSNNGPEMTVVAPSDGNDDLVTTDILGDCGYAGSGDPNPDYTFGFGGTSGATPQVAGLAALIISQNPSLSRTAVTNYITNNADNLGNFNLYGYGRINVEASLRDVIDNINVNVTSPGGGEQWMVGNPVSITWTACSTCDLSGNEVSLSRDNGASWTLLASLAGNKRQYSWTVSGPASSNCRIKVRSYSSLYSDEDQSNLFSISLSPSTVNGTVSDGATGLGGFTVAAVDELGVRIASDVTVEGQYSFSIPSNWTGTVRVVPQAYYNLSTPSGVPISGNGTPETHQANFVMSHQPTTFVDGLLVDNSASSYEDVRIFTPQSSSVTVYCSWTQGTGMDDVVLQKIDGTGEIQWPAPKPLAADPGFAEQDGYLIGEYQWPGTYFWRDYRSGPGRPQLIAGRVSTSGDTLWSTPITTLASAAEKAVGFEDGRIGCYVFWVDNPVTTGNQDNVFVQMIDCIDEGLLWGSPVNLSSGITVAADQLEVDYDDSNGAIAAFVDVNNDKVIVQRVAVDGTLPWDSEPGDQGPGEPASTAPGAQSQPALYGSLQGAWVALTVDDPATGKDIQMNSLDYMGNPSAGWTAEGVRLCDDPGTQEDPQIVDLGTTVFWRDSRGGIYAQRTDYYGQPLWASNGLDMTDGIGTGPGAFRALRDGDYLYLLWETPGGEYRLQKIDRSNGSALWGGGVFITDSYTATPDMTFQSVGANGIFAVWPDNSAPEVRMVFVAADNLEILNENVGITSQSCTAQTATIQGTWTTTSSAAVIDSLKLTAPGGASYVKTAVPSGTSHSLTKTVPCAIGTWSYEVVSYADPTNRASAQGTFFMNCPSCPPGCKCNFHQEVVDVMIQGDGSAPLTVTREFQLEHDAEVRGVEFVLGDSRAVVPGVSLTRMVKGKEEVLVSTGAQRMAAPEPIAGEKGEQTAVTYEVTWNPISLEKGTTVLLTLTLEPGAGTDGALGGRRVKGESGTFLRIEDQKESISLDVRMTAALLFEGVERKPVARLFLSPGTPNPFASSTQIRFGLAQAGHATVTVYDVAGRLVKRLVDEALPEGEHIVHWEGSDGTGRPVATGIYYLRLRSDSREISRKIVRLN